MIIDYTFRILIINTTKKQPKNNQKQPKTTMFNPLNLIQKQKQQQKQQKQQKNAEKQRMETFSKLMQGNVCTREELETMRMKHQMYRKQGHYVSVTEKDPTGHVIPLKEIMDLHYLPIPIVMAKIKILNKNREFINSVPYKEAMHPLNQKYFQSEFLKYCFREIRYFACGEYDKVAVQKLILGKYSFERYLNYKQRFYVYNEDSKCILAEDIDITVVPVPKFPVPKMTIPKLEVPKIPVSVPIAQAPVVQIPKLTTPIVEISKLANPIVPIPIDPAQIVHQETQRTMEEEIIAPRTIMIMHPIGAYENPMDYYLEVIQWCRRCAHYDNCPQVLREAIIELLGNEGDYKEVFSNPMVMLQFIKSQAQRHQYCVANFGSEEEYAKSLTEYIAENGRFIIMRKVTRILGHWGFSQDIKKAAYVALKDHKKMTHQQIREMYLDPKKLLNWLKAFIPKSYTSKDVDAAMNRHGFYYY